MGNISEENSTAQFSCRADSAGKESLQEADDKTVSADSGVAHGFKILKQWWQDHTVTALFLCGIAVGLVLIWFSFVPARDVASRYSPMAEAFADGRWDMAFHPRFGVFFPCVSGFFCKIIPGLSGFRACQLTALLLWAAAVYPLYGIFRSVFAHHVAVAGCAFYLFCSHLHRYIYDGLRDNGKTLGFAMLVYGLILCRNEKKNSISWLWCGAGGAFLAMIRADGFAIASLGLLVYLILDFLRDKKIHRSILTCLLFFSLLLPQCILTWKQSGIFAPNSAYSYVIRRLMDGKAENIVLFGKENAQ